jgi:hypothetical protein
MKMMTVMVTRTVLTEWTVMESGVAAVNKCGESVEQLESVLETEAMMTVEYCWSR